MDRLVELIGVLAALGALAACNTIEGVGKDIKATAAAVEKAAKK